MVLRWRGLQAFKVPADRKFCIEQQRTAKHETGQDDEDITARYCWQKKIGCCRRKHLYVLDRCGWLCKRAIVPRAESYVSFIEHICMRCSVSSTANRGGRITIMQLGPHFLFESKQTSIMTPKRGVQQTDSKPHFTSLISPLFLCCIDAMSCHALYYKQIENNARSR